MQQNPFEFGVVVTGQRFTDRKPERSRLISNFSNLTNTILISPRRWGKSSLVKEAALEMKRLNKNYRFCFIDLFNIRHESEFYEQLASAVVNATSDHLDDARRILAHAFKQIAAKINITTGPQEELSVGFEWNEVKKKPDEVLDFAEKTATKKKVRLIICIDEFQNLEFFGDSSAFQKKLRSHWQHHRNVAYCLYGSKRHMMINIFSKSSAPFYRFGDLMFLNKIPSADFERFIAKHFSKTGKKISNELCLEIISLMKNHPYYVQQLAHIVWNLTPETVTKEIIQQAVNDLLNQNALFYQREADNLSNTQIGLLKAITSGVASLSSAKSLSEFNLGTSASVKKNKTALEKKEIIDLYSGKPEFPDPAFELWFKRNFLHGSIQ